MTIGRYGYDLTLGPNPDFQVQTFRESPFISSNQGHFSHVNTTEGAQSTSGYYFMSDCMSLGETLYSTSLVFQMMFLESAPQLINKLDFGPRGRRSWRESHTPRSQQHSPAHSGASQVILGYSLFGSTPSLAPPD